MENTSGITPLGHAVLVAPYEPEIQQGLIQLPDSVRSRTQLVEQRAVVIAVGSCAWDDEPTPRAIPGDCILMTKFAGYMAVGPGDGKQYRLINDRDVFARISAGGCPGTGARSRAGRLRCRGPC